MNMLLSQSADGARSTTTRNGTTDQHGVPVITSRHRAGTGTASVISDPVTGRFRWTCRPRTVDEHVGRRRDRDPTAAITDSGEKAYECTTTPTARSASPTRTRPACSGSKTRTGSTGLRSSSTDDGLTKFGYRWQSSSRRMVERDTLDAPLSPTNANRYAYAGDDPINMSDPTGRLNTATKANLAETGVGALEAAAIVGIFFIPASRSSPESHLASLTVRPLGQSAAGSTLKFEARARSYTAAGDRWCHHRRYVRFIPGVR